MLKKNFTTPFWLMIILGTLIASIYMYAFFINGHLFAIQPRTPVNVVLNFLLPAIIFIEAIIYLRVRKRNIYRKASRMHILMFAFALATPFLEESLFEFYDDFSPGWEIGPFVRMVTLAQVYAFWTSIVIAHVFFVRLLRRISLDRRMVQPENPDPENLLDDVLS